MRTKVRCAIYTRKSTEEGLEQDFSSLDAQYEACAACIASQKAECWTLVKDRYDDGGLSGGTLARPALQRLLADIASGQIDRIVVYKIDCVTRSLSDFAKIVDQLDAMEASFVSVTQSFNTATSMGRLTLNMLLSFAQFGREVTAERIRDKVAASKRKGLWMGGTVPLGYAKDGRTLAINTDEAPIIKRIYKAYLDLGAIFKVKAVLDRDGCRTRITTGPNGQPRGGKLFSKTHLHALLTSPPYAGKITHEGKLYDGQHPALIPQAMWDQVQEHLSQTAARQRGKGNIAPPSPLIGKLFDASSDRLTPSHTVRNGRHIRYYVSRRLIIGTRAQHPDAWRLPAVQLEPALSGLLQSYLLDERTAYQILPEASAGEMRDLSSKMIDLSERIGSDAEMSVWPHLIERCDIAADAVKLKLDQKAFATVLDIKCARLSQEALLLIAPFNLRKRGFETKIIIGAMQGAIDATLLQNIALGQSWYEDIIAGATLQDIAARTRIDTKRIRQMIEIALLAPDLLDDIISGQQPIGLTTEWLKTHDLPIRWGAQRALVAAAQ